MGISLSCLISFMSRNSAMSDQYGISFLGLNVHFYIFPSRNGPPVTVRRIFEFVHCPISLDGVSNVCNLNGISCAPSEFRVSTYSL